MNRKREGLARFALAAGLLLVGAVALIAQDDMYDPATKQLVWKGTASKQLNPSNSQEKNQENLNKAMAKLLKNFPPKSQT